MKLCPHVGDYNQQGHCKNIPVVLYIASCSDLDAMAESDGKQEASQTVSVDMDAMIDEILARKGPRKYQDGLSEDNWEQVYHRLYLWVYTATATGPHTRAHLLHVALNTCNFCSKHWHFVQKSL